MKRTIAVALLAATVAAGQGITSISNAIRTNSGFNSKTVPRNDDGSAPVDDLGFTINFFGKMRSQVYVNNNGNVTFDSALSTYTPFGLANTAREIIAPFFTDVDTRAAGSALVAYGRDTVDGHPAFGVNYLNVGYYNQHADKLDNFQLVIIDRSDIGAGNFDIEFNYARMQWETGDASGGAGGFGGVSAAVGWSNGSADPGASFELEGSRVPGSFTDGAPFSLTRQKMNSSIPGRLLFRARNGQLIRPLSILTGCPLPSAFLGNAYSQRMYGTGGGTNYRWSAAADPGATFVPGLNLSPEGLLTGSPTAVGTTSFTLRLTASTEDGDQTVSRRCGLTVNPPIVNITSSCPLPSGTVGQAYLNTLRVNGGNRPYTWSVADGALSAPGLSLSSDGTVRGVPTTEGTYFFTLQVTSAETDGATPATKNCSVTVKPAVLDLTSSCSLPPATSGVPYAQNLTVSGGTAPYTWTYSGALPTGLSLLPTGQITGTPDGNSSTAFTAVVTDSRGRSLSQNCTLTVANPQINIATACPLPRATAGRLYSQTLSAGGGSAPYSWSVVGALPAGLSLTGDGVITGTPMTTGPHSFRLLTSDSTGKSVGAACSLQVMPADFFSPSCPLPMGTVGVPYQQQLRSVGGVQPVVFTTTSTLPLGLTLNTYGYVLGTPDKAGTFPLSIRIQDAEGQIATQSCSLLIQPSPVQIESSCPLPQGRVGVPYTASFGANGGTPPYKFFLEGTLPAGLVLNQNGTVTGSPAAQADDRAFYVRVADSQGVTNVIDCSVSVALPDVPSMTFTKIQDTYQPASTGPTITLQLGRTYTLPIQGTINLQVTPDTGQSGAGNQADPKLRFANGQMNLNFTLQPGRNTVSVAIPSTGTVASTVVVTADNLRAGGNLVPLGPTPVSFRVPRQAPSITDACYTVKPGGAEATVTGFSTTRSLTTAAFTYTAGSAQQTVNLDVSSSGADYFLNDDSIRNGGAFTVTFPFTEAGVTPSGVSMTVSNVAGTSASKTLTSCK